MKFTKTHEQTLREFMDKAEYDCVATTDWTSGSGRYTSPRALPPFVNRIEKGQYKNTPRSVNDKAMRYFRVYPRRRVVLVLDREAMMDFLFSSANCKEF